MNWQQIFIGFLLGVLASLLAGFPFYYLSARSLGQESEKLRNMVNMLGRALESRGLAKFTWDETGNMKGVVHFLSGSANIVSSTSSAELTVEKSANSEEK